jgi:hypothetical protein
MKWKIAGFVMAFLGGQVGYYDYSAPIVGLVASGNSYVPLSTTGQSGTAYDNSATMILLGYNSTTHKYYACGSTNPCTGAGGAASFRTGTASNTDAAGQLILASGTATYTFTTANATAPICVASDTSAQSALKATTTTTTLTVTGTGSDTISYICVGRT